LQTSLCVGVIVNAGKRRYQRASRGKCLSIRIVVDASRHATQGAGADIRPSPTGAGLTRTAGPQKSDRLAPARRISVNDRLIHKLFIGDAVFRLVNTRAYACDAASSDDAETA
jgi:hypothetical protein